MKKLITLLIAAIMSLSVLSFTACKKDDANTLWIKVAVAGYGRAWLDDLGDLYEEKYPGKKVEIRQVIKDSDTVVNELLSGSSQFDLIFVENRVEAKYNTKIQAKDGTKYDHPFVDLSDIYQANVPGEDVTMAEKMFDQTYRFITVDNSDGSTSQYSVPWMKSLNSIVVNNKVLQRNNYNLEKFPNTTDELFDLCDDLIQNTDIIPVTYSLEASYFEQVYEAWMFQYYGTEVMRKYYQGYNMDDFNDYDLTIDDDKEDNRYQPEIFFTDGMLEALEVYEELACIENKYIGDKKQETDVCNLDFTSVQNKFLDPENNILFMANGLWLEREMEANYTADELDIEFVKVPVISALGTKLGITDAVLSDIIDYVDDGMTGTKPTFTTTKSFTTDEIIDIVADARSINAAGSNFHSCIAAYSKKIDMAKQFLQLMATDEGLEIMYNACGGSAPFKYSIEKLNNLYEQEVLSKFTYSGNKIILEGKYNFDEMDNLFTKNALWNYQDTSVSLISAFGAQQTESRKSAYDMCVNNYNYCEIMWDTWLRTAGIDL